MGQRWRGRRRGHRGTAAAAPALLAAALLLCTSLLTSCSTSGSPPAHDAAASPAGPPGWRMGWRSETVFRGTNPSPVTCRLAARLAAAGSAVRAEFGSPVGPRGYRLLAADLARAAGVGSLAEVPGSRQSLTFSGASAVQVPAGGRALSDPVRLAVRPGDLIIVTFTVGPGDASLKFVPTEPYACAPGVVPLTAPASAFSRPGHQAYLRTLLVEGPAQRSIVALGDSLTENSLSAPVASYVRWTDQLLADRGSDRVSTVSAVNAGVSGGELTQVGIFGVFTGLQRLQQVLTEPGITDVVVCLGTNDLANSVTPAHLLTAYRDAATLVRRYGARVWITTIPPRADMQWRSAFEIQRVRLNTLLRNGYLRSIGAHLIDLDAALRDPARPGHLDPVADVGDHLHLSPAGEKEFASAVADALGLPER